MSPIDGDVCLMRTPKDQGITVAINGQRFYMDWDGDVCEDWDFMDVGDLSSHVGSRHGHMQFGGEWPHLPMQRPGSLPMPPAISPFSRTR